VSDLWTQLTLEGNTALISKLHHAENKEPGYNVIIVPPQGFSDNDDTHNEVLHWLVGHEILALNTRCEIGRMELALHSNQE
jgi:hypothetical protein